MTSHGYAATLNEVVMPDLPTPAIQVFHAAGAIGSGFAGPTGDEYHSSRLTHAAVL